MRVNMLRVIAIALGITLVDINIYGYDVLPDLLGLSLLFFCAVAFTNQAGRFARTAVVAAVMAFLEVVRLFQLAETDSLLTIFSLLYGFLQVLLVITAADGVAQFSQFQGDDSTPRLCDITGHVYALTFVCMILSWWFADLAMVLTLTRYLITIFTVVMFIYFYSAIYTHVEPFMTESFDDDEGEEGGPVEGEDAEPMGAPVAAAVEVIEF